MREFCRRAMLVGVATSISLLLPENEPKKHVHRTVYLVHTRKYLSSYLSVFLFMSFNAYRQYNLRRHPVGTHMRNLDSHRASKECVQFHLAIQDQRISLWGGHEMLLELCSFVNLVMGNIAGIYCIKLVLQIQWTHRATKSTLPILSKNAEGIAVLEVKGFRNG